MIPAHMLPLIEAHPHIERNTPDRFCGPCGHSRRYHADACTICDCDGAP